MTTLDLSVANGYIIEEHSSNVVQIANANSAVEALARREAMGTNTKRIPRFLSDSPSVFAEGAQITESTVTVDDITMNARKYAKIMHINEEDLNDTFVDVLNKYKGEWATRFARKYDNACLGVTVAADGTDTAPFESLYHAVANASDHTTRLVQSAGNITFAQLSNALSTVESGEYFDPSKTGWIIHPKALGFLRSLVDNNNRPILQDPLGANKSTLFGYPVTVSFGAATSTASTDTPTGNPLIIVGNTDHLINGVRAGIESMVSRDFKYDTDGVLLKVRARRAFAVATPKAFAILEKTAS